MTRPNQKKLAAVAALFSKETDFDRGSEHVDRFGKTVSISLRLPERFILILKELARREGIGYQTLMKRWLDDRVGDELAEMEQSQDAVRAIRKNIEGAMRQLRRFENQVPVRRRKKAAQ